MPVFLHGCVSHARHCVPMPGPVPGTCEALKMYSSKKKKKKNIELSRWKRKKIWLLAMFPAGFYARILVIGLPLPCLRKVPGSE